MQGPKVYAFGGMYSSEALGGKGAKCCATLPGKGQERTGVGLHGQSTRSCLPPRPLRSTPIHRGWQEGMRWVP